MVVGSLFFFFQAEDGIRDKLVTGVQTCALPICRRRTAVIPGRDALRGPRVLALVPVDSRAAFARLPALRRCLGRDGERGEALQPLRLPRRPLREALRRVLRGEQATGGEAQTRLDAVRDDRNVGLLRRLRRPDLSPRAGPVA